MGRNAKLKQQRKEARQAGLPVPGERLYTQREMEERLEDLLRSEVRRVTGVAMDDYESEFIHKNIYAILAAVQLTFGAGKKRLGRFMDKYDEIIRELRQNYLMDIDEIQPLCRRIVDQTGFDLDAWEAEADRRAGGIMEEAQDD